MLLRSVFVAAFGLFAFGGNGLIPSLLARCFGVYTLADGALLLRGATGKAGHQDGRWLTLAEAAVSACAGAIALCAGGITDVKLLLLIAEWALVTGLLRVSAVTAGETNPSVDLGPEPVKRRETESVSGYETIRVLLRPRDRGPRPAGGARRRRPSKHEPPSGAGPY